MSESSTIKVPPLLGEIESKFKKPFEIVSTLQQMNPITANISFPRIIVFGDEDVGKNYIINKLINTDFPSVNVPRILEFHKKSSPSVFLEYEHQQKYVTREFAGDNFKEEIEEAVKNLLQLKKDGSEPITLLINQKYISGLTIVDIPGIRVLEDKTKQEEELKHKRDMLRKFCFDDCMFIHVMSGSKDPQSCQSLKLCRHFDKGGKRTVTIITKNDNLADGTLVRYRTELYENPLGVVFLITDKGGDQQNIGKESQYFRYVENKSFGVDVICENVVKVMLSMVFSPFSLILEGVEADLEHCRGYKEELTKDFNTIGEAYDTIVKVVSLSQQSLEKLIILHKYDEYREETGMHISMILVQFFQDLRVSFDSNKFRSSTFFLETEYNQLSVKNWVFPAELLRSDFFPALLDKQIHYCYQYLKGFLKPAWHMLELAVKRVVADHAKPHNELSLDLDRAVHFLIQKVSGDYYKKVEQILALEKSFPFTLDPDDFEMSWNTYKELKQNFKDFKDLDVVSLNGFNVDLRVLKNAFSNGLLDEGKWEIAFDLKMFMVAYWDRLSVRVTDQFAINMMCVLKEMVKSGMMSTMTKFFMNVGFDTKLTEAPVTAVNRVNVENRIEILEESKSQIKKVLEGIEFLLC